MTGGVVSRTVTVKLSLALFPEPSVAVQLTVVVPSGNVLPDPWLQEGVRPPLTVSEAETPEKPTLAPDGPVASAVFAPGTVMLGGVVSFTLTLADAVLVSPVLVSVAVQETEVVPSGKVLPGGGEQTTSAGPGLALTVTV
jgi:hypothetical protein